MIRRNGIRCLRRAGVALPHVPTVKRCVQLPSPEHLLYPKLHLGGLHAATGPVAARPVMSILLTALFEPLRLIRANF